MNDFTKANGSFETATTEETGVAVIQQTADNGEHFIINLKSRNLSYCSFKPKTEEEQGMLYNMMNSPEKRIADCINMEIEIAHAFIEVVYPINEKTGETKACPRIVLMDGEGNSYQAVSLGVYGSVSKMFEAFGMPDTWSAPKKFMVKQETKGEKKLLVLKYVPTKAKAKANK